MNEDQDRGRRMAAAWRRKRLRSVAGGRCAGVESARVFGCSSPKGTQVARRGRRPNQISSAKDGKVHLSTRVEFRQVRCRSRGTFYRTRAGR
ncbi:hypothetical protein P153DRAFT_168993 [Dothidotthia symphoricarpi CBS 119687]|uniref:Uncharacterized protein n=1 Tax=Dothidotthia symphoricarpi CBS 119687 TaxID=1392245 RepID=A0A6A6AKZ8_9PLEO|nr:uncharacterized protein P153DRAFT_168993 [Dothidotthia symphoricarpi CBS 119687]KAF2132642.1 hypothetical protein P153DRAFT_168993 [Dothidotthia symphoricarpi CBS 119687]